MPSQISSQLRLKSFLPNIVASKATKSPTPQAMVLESACRISSYPGRTKLDKIDFLILVSDKHITSGRKVKKITYRHLMFQGFYGLILY